MTTEGDIQELIRRIEALELKVKKLEGEKAKKQQVME